MKEKALEYVSEAIMTYGNPTLKAELQALDRTSPVRHQMLLALGTTIRDNIIQFVASDWSADNVRMPSAISIHNHDHNHNNNNSNKKKKKNKQRIRLDTNCPIYKALIEMNMQMLMNENILSNEQIQEQQQVVSQWGRPLLPPLLNKLMFEREANYFQEARRKQASGDQDGQHNQQQQQLQTSSSAAAASSTKTARTNVHTTSRSVIKRDSSFSVAGNKDWSKLKKIHIADLKLFESCKGCVLEGTLVTDSITPMVGTCTLLEDSRGDNVKLTLYNFLPSGVTGDDANVLGKKMLPKQSKVKVAEPFFKIFRDGSRGIRVDDPNEIQVIFPTTSNVGMKYHSQNKNNGGGGSREHQEDMLLLRGKQEANHLFEKKLYFAASESYIQLLRSDNGCISTLLSNRAQASIQLGDWTEALCDAAASLTLQPNFQKSWKRYWKALSELGMDELVGKKEEGEEEEEEEKEWHHCQDKEKLRNVLLLMFSSSSSASWEQCGISSSLLEEEIQQNSAEELKSKGNDAFKAGDFDKARWFYSMALKRAGGITHTILSNWSQCAMNLNTWHDAIAASAASLRIFHQKKSVYRLAKAFILIGEPRVSIAVLEKYSNIVKENNALIHKLESGANLFSSNNYNNIQQGLRKCPDLVSNWVGSIETFQTQGKGRGVRALDDIPSGRFVLLERPIISYHLEVTENGNFIASSNGVSDIDDGSHAMIKAAAVNRAQRDGVFSSIVNRLYNGSFVPPLVPFDDLLLGISSANLLLPSHHEYLPGTGERVHLTPDRISEIINRNCHGIRRQDGANKRYFQNDLELGYSELYPAASMFNHAKNPNCEYAKFGDNPYQCIVTKEAIKKGDELTVRYHIDDEVVKRFWLKDVENK